MVSDTIIAIIPKCDEVSPRERHSTLKNRTNSPSFGQPCARRRKYNLHSHAWSPFLLNCPRVVGAGTRSGAFGRALHLLEQAALALRHRHGGTSATSTTARVSAIPRSRAKLRTTPVTQSLPSVCRFFQTGEKPVYTVLLF